MRQELQRLGFEISEAGKHYKITYRGDSRYMVTVGKTSSDNHNGSNNVALISKTMLLEVFCSVDKYWCSADWEVIWSNTHLY